MIQTHGLFLNTELCRYEILGLRKVRRDYMPTDACEPLPFLTKGNLIIHGIDTREELPTPPEFDGVIQKLTKLDISRLRKDNTAKEPKNWQPILHEFVERQTRYVRDLEVSAFRFEEDQSLSEFLMIQKRPALKYDDPFWVDQKIAYPVVSDQIKDGMLVVNMADRVLQYYETRNGEKRQIDIELPVGIFGRLQHVKWPKPTAPAQKIVAKFHAKNA